MAKHADAKLSWTGPGIAPWQAKRPLMLVANTSAKAILDRLGHEQATLGEFETEHAVTLPRDGGG